MAVSRSAIWLQAFRLHTLPLAVASIGLGNFLAYGAGYFHPVIALLTFLTAICLQILSNLANDYGDTKHGADTEDRVGPKRVVQSGLLSPGHIKQGILFFSLLSLVSGCLLLILSIKNIGFFGAMALFVLGLVAIAAAIAYTATKSPYGYKGFGDISVFTFFGVLGVYGSFFLQAGTYPVPVLLPAVAMGLLSAGVLNINNIRDIEGDMRARKITVANQLGLANAKLYHWSLLLSAIVLLSVYMLCIMRSGYQLLFLIPAVLFIINGIGVSRSTVPQQINPYLKQLVISILIFTLSYGLGLILY